MAHRDWKSCVAHPTHTRSRQDNAVELTDIGRVGDRLQVVRFGVAAVQAEKRLNSGYAVIRI